MVRHNVANLCRYLTKTGHQESGREFKETDGSTSTYWVVLIDSENGHHIVFAELDGQFGLAMSGIVVGWHGDLMATIDGM